MGIPESRVSDKAGLSRWKLVTVPLCSSDDVLARPQMRGVSADAGTLNGYIEEASVLIEGYLGHPFAIGETVPNAAKLVCARMVARAITATPVDPNFESYGSSFGPMAHTKHVAQDVLGGGVWLTRQDKLILDGITTNAGMQSINLYALDPCPPPPPNWWLLSPTPGR